jgi:tRNA 2-selenouridine synthase
MIRRIDISEYLSDAELLPLADVRTPTEFKNGHIPGAKNIPLFSDEERAKVGTTYKQVSVDQAYKMGYAFVGPKLDYFVKEANALAKDGKLAVYCWRGGMRSKSFAEHIAANGLSEVFVIEGGYKAFRQYALEAFKKPDELLILGGYTGSGKTHILDHLKTKGEQVIDLEAIANHKGSAFGSIGQEEQPQNEHFTNLLYWEWRKLDYSRAVWLEDESIHIGKVFIPELLFQRMREAKVYFVQVEKSLRARLLVEEYAGINHAMLKDSVQKISKRLGGLRTREALEALDRKDYFETAVITLDYYDKFYWKGLDRRDQNTVIILASETVDPRVNAEIVLNCRKRNLAKT